MNKVILITGASKGIGRDTAIYLKSLGYIVVANYNKSLEDALILKDKYDIDIFKADVTLDDEVVEMVNYVINKYGKIDVLVNNAGIDQEMMFQDITREDFDKVINTNLYGTFKCSQEVFKRSMLKYKDGVIINISSIYGTNGGAFASMYSATKGAIISLTKSLALELGPSNIRVNCIAPGCIDTSMNKRYSKEEWDELISNTPLLRKGMGLDIAIGVKFLIEDSFVTGQVIKIDGGFEI